jgi:hypothetical protein
MNSTSSVGILCVNVSTDSASEGFKLPESLRNLNLTVTVFLLLFLVVGLPWNLLVIVTIVKQRLYTQPTIILLLNLVITDFLVLLLNELFPIVAGLAGEYVFGDTDQVRCEVCEVQLGISKTFFFSSIITVPLLALDRFLYIQIPLRYEKRVTTKRVLACVMVTWIFCVLISLLHSLLLKNARYDQLTLVCVWDTSVHRYFHVLSLLAIVLSGFLLLVCNIWVVFIAQKNIRAIYKAHKPSLNSAQRRGSLNKFNYVMNRARKKKQLHLMQVFGGIILFSTISWLPTALLAVMSYFTMNIPAEYVVASTILFESQVMVHPILESTLIREVRIPMKKLVTCGCYSKRANIYTHQQEANTQGGCCCMNRETSGGGCGLCELIYTAYSAQISTHTHSNRSTLESECPPSNENGDCSLGNKDKGHTPSNENGDRSLGNKDKGPSNENGDCLLGNKDEGHTPSNENGDRSLGNKDKGHTPSNENGDCSLGNKDKGHTPSNENGDHSLGNKDKGHTPSNEGDDHSPNSTHSHTHSHTHSAGCVLATASCEELCTVTNPSWGQSLPYKESSV